MKRNPWNLVTVVLFALLLLAVPLAFLLLPYRRSSGNRIFPTGLMTTRSKRSSPTICL